MGQQVESADDDSPRPLAEAGGQQARNVPSRAWEPDSRGEGGHVLGVALQQVPGEDGTEAAPVHEAGPRQAFYEARASVAKHSLW